MKGVNEAVWIDIFPFVGTEVSSKQDGEQYIRSFDLNQALLRRSSWHFTKDDNFVGTLRRLAAWLPAKIGGYKRWATACDNIQKNAPRHVRKGTLPNSVGIELHLPHEVLRGRLRSARIRR